MSADYFYFLRDHRPDELRRPQPTPLSCRVPQGFQAAFDIRTGKLAAGEFPANARRLVETWAKKNRGALLENWKHAVARKPLERIPGME